MTKAEFEHTVTSFMDDLTTVTLATCDQGKPWAASVFYARRGFNLIFFSSPDSMHSTILARNPRAAATIHGAYDKWQDIKGLQMVGSVQPISSAWARAKATAVYVRRYPFVRQFLSNPGSVTSEVATKMTKVALYIFNPESILYLSNESGFGNRWKIDLEDGVPIGVPVKA